MFDIDSFHFQNKSLGKKWQVKTRVEKEKSWQDGILPPGDELAENEVAKSSQRLTMFYLIMLAVFLVLVSRSFYLQIIQGNKFREEADAHSVRPIFIKAARGIIFDRHKVPLVENIPNFQVVIVPGDLPKNTSKREQVILELSKILNLKEEQIKKILEENKDNSFVEVVVAENITRDQMLLIASKFDRFSGVSVRTNAVRRYKDSMVFSHIIGYIGKLTKEEYEANKSFGYQFDDSIGKAGVELIYEKDLRGQDGKQIIEVDATNRVIKYLGGIIEPVSGNNLVLSIDAGLEQKMYEALETGMKNAKSKAAAAVALNPQTGEVLGMVSLPSYDNNLFSPGVLGDYRSLFNDPLKPMFNRAISGTYPSGSTIKPLVAVAGLTEGIINRSTRLNDPGSIQVVNPYNPSVVYSFSCWKKSGHGSLDVVGAIAQSCDVFFYQVGGGYKGFKGLGAEKLAAWIKNFGLGAKMGIDLPGEAEGLIPTPQWKEKVKHESWYIGDTYLMSIGQGNILVTPLQLTNAIAAIANGGTLYKPKVVREVLDPLGKVVPGKEFKPEVLKSNFIDPSYANLVREGMRQAVVSGTARALANLPVPAAGKTGTAQYGPRNEKLHAWFTCFAPYDNPQIVLTILVEGGGEGSSVAVPIARDILQYYFTR